MQITTDELLFLSLMAGILLLVCTVLLLWFRRIYFDAQTKQPTIIDIPLIGKFRTQAPALVLIIVAAILIIYPISRNEQDVITIKGTANTGGRSVTLLVVPIPKYQMTLNKGGKYHMQVPLMKHVNYRVNFVVDNLIRGDSEATPDKKGVYSVQDFDLAPELVNNYRFRKVTTNGKVGRITDEEVGRLGINN